MEVDLSAFLPLAGGALADDAVVTMAVPAGPAPAAPVVRLDGSDPAKSALNNFSLGAGVIAPPALSAITAVAGTVAANAVAITFGGGPADQAYTVTLTYETNAGPGQTQTINVLAKDTADMVANRAVAAITGDIVATKTGQGVINVALGTATSLTAMAVTVA